MKKLFAGLAIFGTMVFASAQTISFDKTTYDYGTVKTGSDGHRYFVVKNTGDKPLIISKVTPGCGCTVPEWSQNPIMPGKTSLIKVGYSSMNQKGAWGPKTIEVASNDPNNSRSVLYIKGNIADDAPAPEAALTTAPTEKQQLEIFKLKEKEEKKALKEKARSSKKSKAVAVK